MIDNGNLEDVDFRILQMRDDKASEFLVQANKHAMLIKDKNTRETLLMLSQGLAEILETQRLHTHHIRQPGKK